MSKITNIAINQVSTYLLIFIDLIYFAKNDTLVNNILQVTPLEAVATLSFLLGKRR